MYVSSCTEQKVIPTILILCSDKKILKTKSETRGFLVMCTALQLINL